MFKSRYGNTALKKPSPWQIPAVPGSATVAEERCNSCRLQHSVTVIVTCGPGYSQWVKDAVRSIDNSEVEVIVVFDSCEPVPVPCTRSTTVAYGDAHLSRQHGLMMARGEAVLFLDADDVLPRGFVMRASQQLKEAQLKDHRVAGVYPTAQYTDMQGRRTRRFDPPEWDSLRFCLQNFMVISTLCLREALILSWRGRIGRVAWEDALMWRAVVDAGWIFVKGRDLELTVREHPNSISKTVASRSYAEGYEIAHQPITLFQALQGRRYAWDQMHPWLTSLPQNVSIVLCDDSGDLSFGECIRNAKWGSRDLRIYTPSGSVRGLANGQRETTAERVETRVCQLYNRAVQECGTRYMLFVEDDTVPEPAPEQAIKELAEGMQCDVGAVSGVYRSRRDRKIVAWTSEGLKSTKPRFVESTPTRYMDVKGFGFGCVLARTALLKRTPFIRDDREWFDPLIWIKARQFAPRLVLASQVPCVHWDEDKGPIHV